jgi:chromosome segregation ATPase
MRTFLRSFPDAQAGSENGRRQASGPTLREKRGSRALAGACHDQLTRLQMQVKSLEAELTASVHHLERLQSRVAAHERKISAAEELGRAHEMRIEWTQRALEGIFSGRLWRGMKMAGSVRRKLFRTQVEAAPPS